MLPHSELDNYKLQVELLQEKLKRSEENRQKLEHKLENTLHKKTEHEKILRAKQRQKYEAFVNELEQRNERNRQLKQMLERIDQQTVALSSRSERLRMMKMQYEMYFAKLVQSQTMRCIAQRSTSNITATPTPIPVLLPTTPSSVITGTPIKNNENDPSTTSNVRSDASSSAIYQCDASGNLIAVGTVPKPLSVSYTLSPSCHVVQDMPSCNIITPSATTTTTAMAPLSALTAATQHWTLAMATPTPTGMLLTTTPTMSVIPTTTSTATATAASNVATEFVSGMPAYDYMQYPLGYLPRMRDLLQRKPNTSICLDENNDLLQPMDANTKSNRYFRTNKTNDRDNQRYSTTDENSNRIDNDDIRSLNQIDLPTKQHENDKGDVGVLDITKILRQDNGNEHQQQKQQWQQQWQQQRQQHQKPEHLLSNNISTTSSASSVTFDKLPQTMTMTEHASATTPLNSTSINERNNDADDVWKPNQKLATHFDESSQGISIIGCENTSTLTPTKGKSLAKVTTDNSDSTKTPSTVISNDNGNAIEANLRRKIDNMMIPSEQQQHMTQSWQTTESVVTSAETKPGDKDNALNNATVTGGFVEKAENEMTKNNDLNNSSDMLPTITSQNNVTNPILSIEKIENEIYGELVNPPTVEVAKNDARNAAQGLVNELVTKQHEQQYQTENEKIIENLEKDITELHANYDENEPQDIINTDYEQSNSESYDPTYATIEGTTSAEVYQQPVEELAYTDDQNASNNYADYIAEPQQDYTNVNYTNYDTTQYTEAGAYDPNAYPGYTYDAITGQYTPDPAQQYTNQDGTVSYDAQGVYEQQQYVAPQENQEYDYTNYTQETDNAIYTDNVAPPEQINSTQETMELTTNVETLSPNKAVTSNKPTSILSSTDKPAAANDAQKKKKRVNFVDSSETDDSSSVKQGVHPNTGGAGSESDFDFSASEKSGGDA